MNIFISLSLAAVVLLCGCSTPSYLVVTDASNYRDKLIITRSSLTFHNGEYTGSEKGCFPPIEKRICVDPKGDEVYKSTKKLKMETVEIKIRDTARTTSKVVKDMAYLTAAELTDQLGYKTFTITNSYESFTCSNPMYSVDTRGSMVGGSYYGTSQLSEYSICASHYSIGILMFDDPEDLKQGVLSLRTGQARLGPKRSLLSPYKDLYSGTSPGLYEDNLRIEKSSKEYIKKVPLNAWKTRYDIKGLSDELRKQYDMPEKKPYDLEKHREAKKQNAPKQPDLLEKYKILNKYETK